MKISLERAEGRPRLVFTHLITFHQDLNSKLSSMAESFPQLKLAARKWPSRTQLQKPWQPCLRKLKPGTVEAQKSHTTALWRRKRGR